MNIGIIIYSHTGHTLTVAAKLREKLAAAGHEVTLAQIEPVEPVKPGDRRVALRTTPATEPYDAIVFGAPVQGGVPAPPMMSYLEQVASLAGKRVACVVTGVFPAKWGRNQTLAQLQELCTAKGATICGAASVGWWSWRRKQQIATVVEQLSQLF